MRTILACATALLFAACSSTNPYVENRMVLEGAMTNLEAGQYHRTTRTLERMLAETAEEKRSFALQRFFAAYLLTQAHESASAHGPYLQEPAVQRGSFDLNSSSTGTQPSRLGHMMAMIYHASFGRSWYGSAQDAPTEKDGEKLLPAELESFGTQNAAVYMNLCFLAVHSELNFQDRIEEILTGMRELTKLERCEEWMDTVDLDPELRPWIYRGIFEHQKRRDEPNAYLFGIRARETGQDVEAFGEEQMAEITRWITEESSYRFVSPANQPFDPALEGCTVTGTPNLMYEAILRTE